MRITVLAVIIFIATLPALAQVPDDKLIVPGVRIGKWTLEMTIDDLARSNGPGESRTVEPRAGAMSMFPNAANDVKEVMGIRVWPDLALGAAHRQGRNRIEYLVIGAFGSSSFSMLRGFATSQGVAFGYSQDRVIASLGMPTVRSQASNVRERAIYDALGIAIVFLSTSGAPSATEFVVFRPGTAQTIWRF